MPVSAKRVIEPRPAPVANPRPLQKNGRARERLLSAALSLFADRGFEAVTTAQIAAESGVSQSVVLYHFGSKDALWKESMQLLFDRMAAEAPPTEILTDLDPVSRLKVLLRNQVHSSARHPELGRVVLREGSAKGERLQWLSETLLAPHYAMFIESFEQACATGRLLPCNPVLAMIMLHSAAAMLFNLAPLTEPMLGRSPFSSEVIREQSDLLVNVFFRGLMREPNNEGKPR